MIFKYPQFVKVGIECRRGIEKIVRAFPPYSDFNLLSLLSWDVKGENLVSCLDGNLLVRFTDYLTGEPFYSFLGNADIENTIDVLLERSVKEGLPRQLKLVPEMAVMELAVRDGNGWNVFEDSDNHDYVLNVDDLTELQGGRYKRKRQRVGKLKNCSTVEAREMDTANADDRALMIRLWETWAARKEDNIYNEVELKAFLRMLDLAPHFDLVTVGLWDKDTLIGFAVNEVIHDGYYMGHFGKTTGQCDGLSDLLEHETARIMAARGCTLVNLQQDLGLPGLRAYKRSLRPSGFLRKFMIT